MQKQTNSKQRITEYGEVFTNPREVNAMLDLVRQETERIDSRFLEPACGDGNFLAEILRRKLAVVKRKYAKSPTDYEKNAVLAASSIYGVDILQDNVEACRARMFAIWDKEYTAEPIVFSEWAFVTGFSLQRSAVACFTGHAVHQLLRQKQASGVADG